MPALTRVLFNVLCKDLSESVAFYRQLLDLDTVYESDWFVTLSPKGQPAIELGLIDQVSQFTPRHAWGMHEGTYLTFVVDDVFEVLNRARLLGAEVVSEPVALDYGQTRGLIRDLNGMVLDISTPTEDLVGHDEILSGVSAEDGQTEPEPADDRRWGYDAGIRH
jgi:catechol 2,3-dioxygenase-like lactoylglutathione lyase family enzyme